MVAVPAIQGAAASDVGRVAVPVAVPVAIAPGHAAVAVAARDGVVVRGGVRVVRAAGAVTW